MGRLAQKQETVAELQTEIRQATIAVVADYRGLTVSELTGLREELYKEDAQFTVVKNTLMKRAVEGSDLAPLQGCLKGPSAIVWGRADQVQPVKILKAFLTKNKKANEIRGGVLDGKLLSPDEVEQLAKLPPLDELRAKLLGCIASPLNGLVGAVSSQQRGLVNVLDQYAKTKQ